MAAPATPQTRAPQPPQPPQPHTPNGTWKHPQFDEITRRQYATTFDEHNVKVVVANAGLLAASFCADAVTSKVKLLDYAAYVDWGESLQSCTNVQQNARQRPHTLHPLQRVAHPCRPPVLRRQHPPRLPAPRPPLLPRRHCRHPPHALSAHLNGPQAQRLFANTKLRLRFARLPHTTTLLEIHTAQQLQQPGRASFVGLGQSRCYSRKVDIQHVVLAWIGQLGEQTVKLWRSQPVQQQLVRRQRLERWTGHTHPVDWQGECWVEQQVVVREAEGQPKECHVRMRLHTLGPEDAVQRVDSALYPVTLPRRLATCLLSNHKAHHQHTHITAHISVAAASAGTLL